LIGVVLIGGSSLRMGRDKATLMVDGVALGARVAAALRNGGCHDVIAVGGESGAGAALGVPRLADRRPGDGPAAAVDDLIHELGESVLVCSCDLPAITSESVAALLTAADQHTDADAVVVAVNGRRQYPNGVWRQVNRVRPGATFDELLDGRSVREVDLGEGFVDADLPGDLPAER